MACFKLSRALEGIGFSVPQSAPLVRVLLRTAGRVVIDTGGPGADPAIWPGTEEMALRWLESALRPLGYRVAPVEGEGRPEIVPDEAGWQ